jgi:hypothetical protein
MVKMRRHPLLTTLCVLCLIGAAAIGYLVEEVESYPHLIDR